MEELARFHREIIEIYGYSVQCEAAFGWFRMFLDGEVSGPGPTTASNTLFFGRDDPRRPDAKYRYRATFGDMLARCASDGPLLVTHRRNVVVLIVASWEHVYRERIAEELGFSDKNDVKSDAFRDLNRIRNAILHAGNELRDDPSVIRLFEVGEQISLTSEHMEHIFEALVEALNEIGRGYYRSDPQFGLDIPLNN